MRPSAAPARTQPPSAAANPSRWLATLLAAAPCVWEYARHHAALRIDLRRAVAGDRQRHHGVLLDVLIRDLVVAKLREQLRALVGVGF